ncbi:MAG: hypothetical protein ACR2KX_00980, partial [Chitinophagaceae bacterium]
MFSNCSKNKNNIIESYPKDFNAYFNFVKADQQPFQKNDVQISSELQLNSSGMLEPISSQQLVWGQIPQSTVNAQVLFGPYILGGAMDEIKYSGQSLIYNSYRFIRLNNTGQDTLHTVTTNDVNSDQKVLPVSFDVFYNNKKTITFLAKDYSNNRPPGKPWV